MEFAKVLLEHYEPILKRSIHLGSNVRNGIHHMFCGSIDMVTRCHGCGRESRRPDRFEVDGLRLPFQGKKTLEEALQAYFLIEQLDADNKYACDDCLSTKGEKQVASRSLVVRKLPPILSLQLLRFEFSRITGERYKVKEGLQIPDVVDLTAVIRSANPEGYQETAPAASSERSSASVAIGASGPRSSNSSSGAADSSGTGFATGNATHQQQELADTANAPIDLCDNGPITESASSGTGERIVDDPSTHAVYELSSVLYHKGTSAHHGHYVCDVWDSERCVWWHFDDDEVEVVTARAGDGDRAGSSGSIFDLSSTSASAAGGAKGKGGKGKAASSTNSSSSSSAAAAVSSSSAAQPSTTASSVNAAADGRSLDDAGTSVVKQAASGAQLTAMFKKFVGAAASSSSTAVAPAAVASAASGRGKRQRESSASATAGGSNRSSASTQASAAGTVARGRGRPKKEQQQPDHIIDCSDDDVAAAAPATEALSVSDDDEIKADARHAVNGSGDDMVVDIDGSGSVDFAGDDTDDDVVDFDANYADDVDVEHDEEGDDDDGSDYDDDSNQKGGGKRARRGASTSNKRGRGGGVHAAGSRSKLRGSASAQSGRGKGRGAAYASSSGIAAAPLNAIRGPGGKAGTRVVPVSVSASSSSSANAASATMQQSTLAFAPLGASASGGAVESGSRGRRAAARGGDLEMQLALQASAFEEKNRQLALQSASASAAPASVVAPAFPSASGPVTGDRSSSASFVVEGIDDDAAVADSASGKATRPSRLQTVHSDAASAAPASNAASSRRSCGRAPKPKDLDNATPSLASKAMTAAVAVPQSSAAVEPQPANSAVANAAAGFAHIIGGSLGALKGAAQMVVATITSTFSPASHPAPAPASPDIMVLSDSAPSVPAPDAPSAEAATAAEIGARARSRSIDEVALVPNEGASSSSLSVIPLAPASASRGRKGKGAASNKNTDAPTLSGVHAPPQIRLVMQSAIAQASSSVAAHLDTDTSAGRAAAVVVRAAGCTPPGGFLPLQPEAAVPVLPAQSTAEHLSAPSSTADDVASASDHEDIVMTPAVWAQRRSHAGLQALSGGSKNAYMLVYTRVSSARLKQWTEWNDVATSIGDASASSAGFQAGAIAPMATTSTTATASGSLATVKPPAAVPTITVHTLPPPPADPYRLARERVAAALPSSSMQPVAPAAVAASVPAVDADQPMDLESAAPASFEGALTAAQSSVSAAEDVSVGTSSHSVMHPPAHLLSKLHTQAADYEVEKQRYTVEHDKRTLAMIRRKALYAALFLDPRHPPYVTDPSMVGSGAGGASASTVASGAGAGRGSKGAGAGKPSSKQSEAQKLQEQQLASDPYSYHNYPPIGHLEVRHVAAMHPAHGRRAVSAAPCSRAALALAAPAAASAAGPAAADSVEEVGGVGADAAADADADVDVEVDDGDRAEADDDDGDDDIEVLESTNGGHSTANNPARGRSTTARKSTGAANRGAAPAANKQKTIAGTRVKKISHASGAVDDSNGKQSLMAQFAFAKGGVGGAANQRPSSQPAALTGKRARTSSGSSTSGAGFNGPDSTDGAAADASDGLPAAPATPVFYLLPSSWLRMWVCGEDLRIEDIREAREKSDAAAAKKAAAAADKGASAPASSSGIAASGTQSVPMSNSSAGVNGASKNGKGGGTGAGATIDMTEDDEGGAAGFAGTALGALTPAHEAAAAPGAVIDLDGDFDVAAGASTATGVLVVSAPSQLPASVDATAESLPPPSASTGVDSSTSTILDTAVASIRAAAADPSVSAVALLAQAHVTEGQPRSERSDAVADQVEAIAQAGVASKSDAAAAAAAPPVASTCANAACVPDADDDGEVQHMGTIATTTSGSSVKPRDLIFADAIWSRWIVDPRAASTSASSSSSSAQSSSSFAQSLDGSRPPMELLEALSHSETGLTILALHPNKAHLFKRVTKRVFDGITMDLFPHQATAAPGDVSSGGERVSRGREHDPSTRDEEEVVKMIVGALSKPLPADATHAPTTSAASGAGKGAGGRKGAGRPAKGTSSTTAADLGPSSSVTIELDGASADSDANAPGASTVNVDGAEDMEDGAAAASKSEDVVMIDNGGAGAGAGAAGKPVAGTTATTTAKAAAAAARAEKAAAEKVKLRELVLASVILEPRPIKWDREELQDSPLSSLNYRHPDLERDWIESREKAIQIVTRNAILVDAVAAPEVKDNEIDSVAEQQLLQRTDVGDDGDDYAMMLRGQPVPESFDDVENPAPATVWMSKNHLTLLASALREQQKLLGGKGVKDGSADNSAAGAKAAGGSKPKLKSTSIVIDADDDVTTTPLLAEPTSVGSGAGKHQTTIDTMFAAQAVSADGPSTTSVVDNPDLSLVDKTVDETVTIDDAEEDTAGISGAAGASDSNSGSSSMVDRIVRNPILRLPSAESVLKGHKCPHGSLSADKREVKRVPMDVWRLVAFQLYNVDAGSELAQPMSADKPFAESSNACAVCSGKLNEDKAAVKENKVERERQYTGDNRPLDRLRGQQRQNLGHWPMGTDHNEGLNGPLLPREGPYYIFDRQWLMRWREWIASGEQKDKDWIDRNWPPWQRYVKEGCVRGTQHSGGLSSESSEPTSAAAAASASAATAAAVGDAEIDVDSAGSSTAPPLLRTYVPSIDALRFLSRIAPLTLALPSQPASSPSGSASTCKANGRAGRKSTAGAAVPASSTSGDQSGAGAGVGSSLRPRGGIPDSTSKAASAPALPTTIAELERSNGISAGVDVDADADARMDGAGDAMKASAVAASSSSESSPVAESPLASPSAALVTERLRTIEAGLQSWSQLSASGVAQKGICDPNYAYDGVELLSEAEYQCFVRLRMSGALGSLTVPRQHLLQPSSSPLASPISSAFASATTAPSDADVVVDVGDSATGAEHESAPPILYVVPKDSLSLPSTLRQPASFDANHAVITGALDTFSSSGGGGSGKSGSKGGSGISAAAASGGEFTWILDPPLCAYCFSTTISDRLTSISSFESGTIHFVELKATDTVPWPEGGGSSGAPGSSTSASLAALTPGAAGGGVSASGRPQRQAATRGSKRKPLVLDGLSSSDNLGRIRVRLESERDLHDIFAAPMYTAAGMRLSDPRQRLSDASVRDGDTIYYRYPSKDGKVEGYGTTASNIDDINWAVNADEIYEAACNSGSGGPLSSAGGGGGGSARKRSRNDGGKEKGFTGSRFGSSKPSSTSSGGGAAPPSTWICSACTFENEVGDTKCAVCGCSR